MKLEDLTDEQIIILQKVQEAAKQAGVDPTLATAVAFAESGLNPKATSPKGAIGIMQLMPATAKQLGVDPADVDENIRGGVQYLKKQINTFNDPVKALIAYNAGPDSKFFKTGDLKDLPDETLNYVAKVTSMAPIAAPKEAPPAEKPGMLEQAMSGMQAMTGNDERLQDVGVAAGLGAAKGVAEKFFIDPKAPVQISEKDIFGAQKKVAEAQERLNSLKEIAASKNLNPQELEQIRIKANDELLNATSELREARAAQRASMREPIPTVESIAERMAKAEAADAAARAEKLTGAQNYAKSMYGRTGAPEPLPQSLIDKIESMSGKTERGATTLMREEEARRAAARLIDPNIRLFDPQGIALPEEIGRERMAAQQMEAEAARQSSILERNTAAFAERQAEAQRVLQAQQEAAAKVEAAREQRRLAQLADQEARRQASEARKLTSQLETRQQNVDEAMAIAERLSKERPGGLQRFLTNFGLRAAKSPILMGGLGGAGVALSFDDAMERYKNGDRTGAVLSALEAGLSAMSMAPPVGIGIPIKGLGTAGALGLLPLIMYRDYLKNRPEAPQEISSTR